MAGNAVNQPAIGFGTTGTIALSVTNASASVRHSTGNSTPRHIRIYVQGANDVFFELGGSGVVAAIPVAGGAQGGFPVKAGTDKLIATEGQQYIAAIASAAGPTLVYITPCEGNSL